MNFQEIKMKDLNTKIKDMNSHLDNDMIWRKEFDDMGLTVSRIKERLDDDMDIVTRNVREAKDRMGEMTVRFKMACDHTKDQMMRCTSNDNTTPLNKLDETAQFERSPYGEDILSLS